MKKQLTSVFGNSYEVELISQEDALASIEAIGAHEISVGVVGKMVEMQGYRVDVLFNLETGKLEFHGFLGNTDFQENAHRVLWGSWKYPLTEGLEVEDILDAEEIEEEKLRAEKEDETPDFWSVIKNHPDLDIRMADAMTHYYYHASAQFVDDQSSVEDNVIELYAA